MVDKIVEFGKNLAHRVMLWWNKFEPKQKTLIICVSAGVVVAIAIMVAVLTRKQYVELATCETTKEAGEIQTLLDTEGLTYKISSDGLKVDILDEQEATARVLLGSNNIPTSGFSLEDALNGGFSTTEADKQKKYKQYIESKFEQTLKAYKGVERVTVSLTLPEKDGTLIAQKQEAYAGISLVLSKGANFTEDVAKSMANLVACSLGNTSTDNITITDSDGRIWFPVEDSFSSLEKTDTMMLLKQEAESLLKQEVRKVLLGTNEFTQVEVATNVVMDFSKTEETEHTYRAPDGKEQGYYSHDELYKSNSKDGLSGVPGTDSNSETDYMINEGDGSTLSTYEHKRDYLLDEKITTTVKPTGQIVYPSSSMSISAIRYKVVKEEDAKLQGLLEEMSWAEYKLANSGRTKLETDKDLVSMAANATGIPSKNITLVAYEELQFIDAIKAEVNYKDIIQIALIIIILGLLGFVVFMSLHQKKDVEEEEELAVEDLLQSAPEDDLEGIELEQKSEARKLIESFVEENPEAVATLLRNWLEEEWGAS